MKCARKATQFGRVLKSEKSKNVANGLKASEKVRKGRKSEREQDRKSTRLNSSHLARSRMPSSA